MLLETFHNKESPASTNAKFKAPTNGPFDASESPYTPTASCAADTLAERGPGRERERERGRGGGERERE